MSVPDELRRYVPRTDLYDSYDLIHYHMPLEQPPSTASYIIFKKGNKYYAKNGTYGHIEFEGTDAATVIQSAIDASEGEIFIKKAIYEISSSITLKSGLRLRSDGAILKVKDNAGKVNVLWLNDVSDVVIEGLKIDGNKANNAYQGDSLYQHGILIRSDCSNVTIAECEIYNTVGSGIQVAKGEKIWIINNIIHDCGTSDHPSNDGVTVLASEKVYIIGNYFYNNYDQHVIVQIFDNVRCSDFIIKENIMDTVVDAGDNAVLNIWESDNGVVEGNIIRNVPSTGVGGEGIRVEEGHNIIIKGNRLENILLDGIRLYNDSYECTIIGNIIKDAGRGIRIESTNRTIVIGNILYNISKSPGYGLILAGTASHNILAENIARNCVNGLVEVDNADYNIIIGNDLRDNDYSPYRPAGANSYVFGNQGYVTENSGTATISSGSTSVTVSHGLADTPSKVLVTPIGDPGDRFWVANVGSSSFDIVVATAPSADTDFYWQAEL